MLNCNPGRLNHQVESLRLRFAQTPGLPFDEVLLAEQVRQVLEQEQVQWRETVYTPLVTVRLLLSQAVDADPSCQQAVDLLLAERAAQGAPALSANNGAYCQARLRLPEGVLRRLTRQVGKELLAEAPVPWLWKGRDVKIVDGTTVSMPASAANQAAYPQPHTQKKGVGFPLLRLVVLFSLAVGTVLEAALGRYQGKETGETALFRSLHDSLFDGDIVVADRYYCSYFEIALLQERRVDVVFRLHQRRRADFRRGRRLGPDDHVVLWHKPVAQPTWLDEATYQRLPPTLTLREVRVRVTQAGFRSRSIVVVTTLLDADLYASVDLTDLYRARWQAELNLRSLKAVMTMKVLRAKTPAMVRKELWAHLLAYNLIRTVMAQAALAQGLKPQNLSFKGALQTVNSFAPYLLTAQPSALAELSRQLLVAIAQHRVGQRPDRYEPRKQKRRPQSYPFLNETRAKARARLATRVCA
jgi:hypothetical protein